MSDASSDAQEILFEEPYKRLLPEYASLPTDELIGINRDIPKTVNIVIGTCQRLARLTARIAEELPDFDVSLIDSLDEYAMALSHAHTLFSLADESDGSLRLLVEEGRKLRATLLADAGALVRRGHLRDGRLKELRGPKRASRPRVRPPALGRLVSLRGEEQSRSVQLVSRNLFASRGQIRRAAG
jgi:hypothetical protein